MSYFHAQLGKGIHEERLMRENARRLDQRALPLFGAQLGQKPAAPAQPGSAKEGVMLMPSAGFNPRPTANSGAVHCPLCQGDLVLKGGLYRCTARCGASWLEDRTGHLVDITGLPYGICGCCRPPQMLVQSAGGAVCPGSTEEYLLLPEGIALRSDVAPHGLCQCCVPPAPLMEEGDGLVCRLKPTNRYRMADDGIAWLGIGPNGNEEKTLQAIDKALSENSAKLTLYGLFDIE